MQPKDKDAAIGQPTALARDQAKPRAGIAGLFVENNLNSHLPPVGESMTLVNNKLNYTENNV
ncbi:hypothetical protein ACVWYY_002206 [Thermostichus sp. MS-CIW-34]|jgi:hypothetical protein